MALPWLPVHPLAVFALPVFPVKVGQVAVLVPPRAMVCQSTVAESHIIVSVPRCELPAIVVGHGIPSIASVIPHRQPVSLSARGNLEEVIDSVGRLIGCPQIHPQLIADGAAACEVVQLVKT